MRGTDHSSRTASPQLEDGYTRIADELLEAMARTSFSPNQSKCFLLLIRKTYGFQKRKVKITTKEWVLGTCMERSNIYHTLKELVQRNMVVHTDHQWAVQKDYTRWRRLPNRCPRIPLVVRTDHQMVVRTDHRIIKDKRHTPPTPPRGGSPRRSKKEKLLDPKLIPHIFTGLLECKECHITRPGATFDEHGVCDWCQERKGHE